MNPSQEDNYRNLRTLIMSRTDKTKIFSEKSPDFLHMVSVNGKELITRDDVENMISLNPGPQGPQGDPGSDGAQGAQGPQGEQGSAAEFIPQYLLDPLNNLEEFNVPCVQYSGPSQINTNSWRCVSMSSSGRYQTAITDNGNIYNSSDFGNTWILNLNIPSGKYLISIAVSSSGQYQTIVSNSDSLYRSDDFGVTWDIIASTDSRLNWYSVAMSASGQYQTAVIYGLDDNTGKIYTSSDYGFTFTETSGPIKNWIYVAMSGTAKYQTAIEMDGDVYTSSDYGVTWTINNNITNSTWRSVSLSYTGQYQVMSDYGNAIYISSNYGVTWSSVNLPNLDYFNTAISASGQYQIVTVYNGGIYTSSDYGVTWENQTSIKPWKSVAMSASGQYKTFLVEDEYIYTANSNLMINNSSIVTKNILKDYDDINAPENYLSDPMTQLENFDSAFVIATIAQTSNWLCAMMNASGKYRTIASGGGFLYTSSDYGVTWVSNTQSLGKYWQQGAISASGKYQTLPAQESFQSSGTYIYRSSDYGVTFTATSSPQKFWKCVAMSGSGKYQSACEYDLNNEIGEIYISSDYGVNWRAVSKQLLKKWSYIAMSYSGKYQSACVNGGDIYTSSDYGLTWRTTNSPSNLTWSSISVSYSGQYQSACVTGGSIYISSDYGVTWNIVQSTNIGWSCIAINYSGQYQCACSSGVNIYTSSDYGLTWTSTNTANFNWRNVAINASGEYKLAVATTKAPYQSHSNLMLGNSVVLTKDNFTDYFNAGPKLSYTTSLLFQDLSVDYTGVVFETIISQLSTSVIKDETIKIDLFNSFKPILTQNFTVGRFIGYISLYRNETLLIKQEIANYVYSNLVMPIYMTYIDTASSTSTYNYNCKLEFTSISQTNSVYSINSFRLIHVNLSATRFPSTN